MGDIVGRAPMLSVVVPAYNGSDYLGECLDSILTQSMSNFELICVDDGSSDNTLDILKAYAAGDNRITIISQKNAGVSAARNAGMEVASGRYIIFLDDDDYFEPQMFELMTRQLEQDNADICVCGGYRYDMDMGRRVEKKNYLKVRYLPEHRPFTLADLGNHAFDFIAFFSFNKMCRRETLVNAGVYYKPYRTSEDALFSIEALLAASTITAVEKPLVTYRVGGKDSLSSSVSQDFLAGYRALCEIQEILRIRGLYQEPFKQSFVNKAASHLFGDNLVRLSSYESFIGWYTFMRKEGIYQLGLAEPDEAYFYRKAYYEKICLLKEAKSGELFLFGLYRLAVEANQQSADRKEQLKTRLEEYRDKNIRLHGRVVTLKERNAKLQAQLNAIQHSRSYQFARRISSVFKKGKSS